jgi:glucose-6-phosphate isomerase
MTAHLPDWMNRPRCDQTPAWRELGRCYEQTGRAFDLRQAFAAEPDRFDRFSVNAPQVFADLSRNRIDAATTRALLALAQECRLELHRDAMFAGEAINTTEGRAVLHTLLRCPRSAPGDAVTPALQPLLSEVHNTLDAMLAFAEDPARRPGHHRCGEHRHRRFRPGPADGGAGARCLCRHSGKRLHFVSQRGRP